MHEIENPKRTLPLLISMVLCHARIPDREDYGRWRDVVWANSAPIGLRFTSPEPGPAYWQQRWG